MKSCLLVIILLLSLYAESSVNGKILFSNDTIMVGDTVPAKIIFSIQNNEKEFHDEDFLEKTIHESLYISEVYDHHISENNHDMYEVNVLLTIVRSFIPGHELIMALGHLDIRLTTDEKLVVEKFTENLPKELVFIESNYQIPLSKTSLLMISLVSALILLLIYIWFSRRKKSQKKNALGELEFNNLKRKWSNSVLNAKNRNDYEEIFNSRKEWERLLNNSSAESQYRKTMDLYIYKKNWEQPELVEVEKIHQELLRNFKVGI